MKIPHVSKDVTLEIRNYQGIRGRDLELRASIEVKGRQARVAHIIHEEFINDPSGDYVASRVLDDLADFVGKQLVYGADVE